jgi:hypothetical protein
MNLLMEQAAAIPVQLPVVYERACQSLAECNAIDECQEWADKAAALASYARQAEDKTLENYAIRIRSRAVKRAGELLKQYDGRPANASKQTDGDHGLISQRAAAEAAGMSEHQQLQAVRVAKVPVEEFEEQVESEHPPTLTELAEQGKKTAPVPIKPPGFAEATKFIGELERLHAFLKDNPPDLILAGMKTFEIEDVLPLAASVREWLDLLIQTPRGGTDVLP